MVLRFLLLLVFCQTASAQLMNMQTLINGRTNEFIGVVIGTGEFAPNSRIIMIGISTPEQKKALEQVRSMGLHGYSINGKVYGLKKAPENISISYSTTVGIRIGGGCGSNDLCLGKDSMYGISASFRPDSNTEFREKDGVYLEDPISKVIKAGGILLDTVTVRETIEDILQITSVIASRVENLKRPTWPTEHYPMLTSIASGSFNLEKTETADHAVGAIEKYSSEFKRRDVVATELRTKSFINRVNMYAPIWNSVSAQTYVQNFCNKIIVSTDLPATCRIFADLFPYAFSYPGGDVFINAGLFAAAEDESTIAFFLAHELTHIYACHFSETIAKKDFEAKFFNSVSLLSSVLSVRSLKLHLANSFGHEVTSKSLPEIYAAMMTNYTADQEVLADQAAFAITQGLGYSRQQILRGLTSLANTLENYYSDEQKPSARLTSRFAKFQKRLELLKKAPIFSSKSPSEDLAPSEQFLAMQKQLQDAYDFVRFSFLAK